MKDRLEEVDYLRAIACISVVLVHLTGVYLYLDTTGTVMKTFFLCINRALIFAVPAFIFISGFVLAYNYRDKEFAFFPFIKKRTKYLLVPYFFWTCFYYVVFVSQKIYQFSLTVFLQKLFLGDMVYHLYFVLIILQFYFLFGIINWLFKRFSSHLLLAVMLVINLLFMKYVHFQYVDRFFLQYLCFFVLGVYFATNYSLIKEKICYYKYGLAVGYVLMTALIAQQYYHNIMLQNAYDVFRNNLYWLGYSLLAILFYYFLALLILRSPYSGLKKFLYKISEGSYYIYLSHPFVLMVALKIIKYEYFPSTALNFLFTLLFVFGTILPTTFLYKTWKKSILNN